MKNSPDFICIGMQKAGTTWLAANLSQHPSVWIPPIKEIHYFDEVHIDSGWYKKRQDVSLSNLNRFDIQNAIKSELIAKEISFWEHMGKRYINDDWYQTIWRSFSKNYKIAGDITPAYSILPLEGIKHVHKIAPDAKIIILLRDPIERTWSSVRMYAKEQYIDPLECFKEEFIINRSKIIQMLQAWEKVYSRNNFFIAFYEDIAIKPHYLLQSICDFLEINFNENYFLSATEKIHVGKAATMPNYVLAAYKEIFYDDINFACNRFQSYSKRWFNRYYQ
jgi:hypothetical protein